MSYASFSRSLDQVEEHWRQTAGALRPLPRLSHVTLEGCTCSEEVFFELISKFPATARITLISDSYLRVWQSYARQFPPNVTHLTIPDTGCHDILLKTILDRFASLSHLSLVHPSEAQCRALAALPHRTALIHLSSKLLFEPDVSTLSRFPRLREIWGLTLRAPLSVEEIAQANFPSLRAVEVLLEGSTSVRDLHALLPALPALRHLVIHLPKQDVVLRDMQALLSAVMPRLASLSLRNSADRTDDEETAVEAAWLKLQQQIRSGGPWLQIS